MPLSLQARLLRVLAEREVLPIGATRAVRVDLRVIAATHAELQDQVRAGRFRDDLYYRLAGAHLVLPPLRQRRDLPWLVAKLLREAGRRVQLGPDAEHWLRAHAWPGNLRELKNVIDYASAMAGDGGVIGVAELPDALLSTARAEPAAPACAEHAALPAEAQLLLQYLRAARWNVSAVAHQLGVARMTIYRRMKRWGIRDPHAP
jgi:transcriptional regulator of acetoin/glycerol metabolism